MRFSISVSGGLGVLLALVLVACAGDDPVDPEQQRDEPPDYDLVQLSGDGQVGKVGEELPERLEVRVTDAAGEAVAGAEVVWSTSRGAGDLMTSPVSDDFGSKVSDITGSDGVSSVGFRPTELGTLTVTAEAGGSGGPTVSFTTEVDVLVIGFTRDPIDGDYFWTDLAGWHQYDDFVVPVGTAVEWKAYAGSIWTVKARIRSTSVPPGGLSFDSGDLAGGDRFRFVPSVEGSWEFVEEGTGTDGTLTAR